MRGIELSVQQVVKRLQLIPVCQTVYHSVGTAWSKYQLTR